MKANYDTAMSHLAYTDMWKLFYIICNCKLILILIYNSFVNSKLSYCIEIWSNAPAVYLNKLFLMQKKIIRIINKKPFDYSTSELFKKNQNTDNKQNL